MTIKHMLKSLICFSTTAFIAISAHAAVDLRGYDGRPDGSPFNQYYFDVQQTSAKWGENIGVRLAVTNVGSTASTPCKVRLYLSKNTAIGDSDDRVFGLPVNLPSIPGGGYIAGYNYYENFQLPSTNPYGDSSTVFYIGMVVDADGEVAESNEANNRNQGNGSDKDTTAITITGPAPKVQLSANGTSLPPASSLSVAFGNVAADGAGGAALTQTVTLANTGDLSLSVTGISANGTGFSLKNIGSNIQSLTQPVTFPRSVAASGQEAWSIDVEFDPATARAHSGSLVVTSNDTTRPSVSISLSGTGTPVPQLSVNYGAPAGTDPRTMDFGAVINDGAGGATANRTVTLTNPGTGPLTVSQNGLSLINGTGWHIVSITSNTQGAINLASAAKTIAAAGAETWSVLLRFDPASVASFSGGFQILSNDPKDPTYALALNGSGVVPMTLDVRDSIGTDSDRAMNFGRVHADGAGLQQKSGTLTLKNAGGAPLTISQNGIALGSSTNFKIASIQSSTQGTINLGNGTRTIAAGGIETWTVSLVFDPTTSGALSTQLQILSNDPSQGTVSVSLSGTGLNQPGIETADSVGAANDRTLDFGPTLNDGAGARTRTQAVTIKNIGTQNLVVSQNGIAVVSGTKFTVQSIVSSIRGAITISSSDPVARTIAPLGAETWTVTTAFDPDANSAFTGTLRVTSNDPDAPTVDFSLSGSGVQPAIALNPTTPATTLFIAAGQVHPITWSATYTGGDAQISLYRDTDTNPANGNTLIVSGLLQSAGSSYEWRPEPSLAGQEFYLYAMIADGTVSNGSFSGRKVRVDAVGDFQLLSAVETASADYAYEYEYLGKLYTKTITLQPGQNSVTVITPLIGGGNATHEFSVNKGSSLLQSEGYTYDEMQRIKTYRNGNGIVTTYYYDLAGRLDRTVATNGAAVQFGYDTLSRREFMTDSTGTTFYEYDDLDRLKKVITSVNAIKGDADDLVLSYGEYDPAGNIKTLIYPGGEQITYTYDDAGRMKTATNGGFTAAYFYDPMSGLLKRVERSNGLNTEYGYNNMGRLNLVTHKKTAGAGATLAEYSYSLNAIGNADDLTITLPTGTKKEDYKYDGMDRLRQVTYTNGTGADPNAKVVTYTYTDAGNRHTEKVEIGGVLQKLWTYHYGSENRLLFITDQSGTEIRRYAYDAAGNRKQKITPDGTTFYTYDERNLLTRIQTPTDTIRYTYNGLGHRVSKTFNGVLSQFIIDSNRPIFETVQERSTTGITASYTYGLDRLLRKPATGSAEFYLHDRIGSVRHIADPSANVTEGFTYDAFGAQEPLP